LKKRSKKLLLVFGQWRWNQHSLNYQSFFCFFFVHKKEDSSSFLTHCRRLIHIKASAPGAR
jgi:hypothetical protein